MIVYSVNEQDDAPEGEVFIESLREARSIAKATAQGGRHCLIARHDIPVTRAGIIAALNRFGIGHEPVEEWQPIQGSCVSDYETDPQFPKHVWKVTRVTAHAARTIDEALK